MKKRQKAKRDAWLEAGFTLWVGALCGVPFLGFTLLGIYPRLGFLILVAWVIFLMETCWDNIGRLSDLLQKLLDGRRR